MNRIDGPTRSAALPAPLPVGTGGASPGYFARGDLLTGTPYTTLDPDWANAVQEELVGVIEAAGITPDKANVAQLLAALQVLFVANGAGGVHIGTDQVSFPLPGGFILKCGQYSAALNEQSLTINFDAAFPTKCWAAVPIAVNSSATATRDVWAQYVSSTTGSFTCFLNKSGGTGNTDTSDGVVWIAVGN